MNKTKKIWIIIACTAVAAGLLIALIAAIIGENSLFSNDIQREMKTYSVDENFTNISINNTAYDIVIRPSENKKCTVECLEEEKLYHTVEVTRDTLTITEVNKKKWYENFYFGIFPSNWTELCLTVYLPKEKYENLLLKNTSGDISVKSKITFTDIEVHNTSGDVSLSDITAENISAKSTSGDVLISNSNIKSELFLKSTSGDTKATDIKADNLTSESTSGNIIFKSAEVKSNILANTTSGEIEFFDVSANDIAVKSTSGDAYFTDSISKGRLFAKTVSGDIELERCDGKNIDLQSTSGEIDGSLLTGKKFITNTTSGDIRVPSDSGTDKCVISTVSGDIEIYVVK